MYSYTNNVLQMYIYIHIYMYILSKKNVFILFVYFICLLINLLRIADIFSPYIY